MQILPRMPAQVPLHFPPEVTFRVASGAVLEVWPKVALRSPPQVLFPVPLLIAAEIPPQTTANVALEVPIRTTS